MLRGCRCRWRAQRLQELLGAGPQEVDELMALAHGALAGPAPAQDKVLAHTCPPIPRRSAPSYTLRPARHEPRTICLSACLA